MKIYRLHRTYEHGTSNGYQWFTRKDEAEKAGRDWINDSDEDMAFEIQPVFVSVSRPGIMEVLNTYAKHADNG